VGEAARKRERDGRTRGTGCVCDEEEQDVHTLQRALASEKKCSARLTAEVASLQAQLRCVPAGGRWLRKVHGRGLRAAHFMDCAATAPLAVPAGRTRRRSTLPRR